MPSQLLASLKKSMALNAGTKRSKIANGQSQKRGCKFHFTVQQCYCAPELARVFYSAAGSKHINHGSALPPDAAGPDARFKIAARLSQGLRTWVERRLLLGVAPAKILEEHNASLKNRYAWQAANSEFQPPLDRDSMLTIQDIRNYQTKIGEQTWKLHPHEGQGIFLWIQQRSHDAAFCYNPGGKINHLIGWLQFSHWSRFAM